MKILCLLIFTAIGAWAQCGQLVLNPFTGLLDCTGASSSSLAFSGLTSATNTTAAMVVGTGASLTVSGSGAINATSLGGSAAALYLLKSGGTMTGNLLFTDATLDIGASGATRPRSIYTSSQIFPGANIVFADGAEIGNSNPAGSGVKIQGASGAYVQVQLIPLGGGDSIFYLYKNQDPAFKVTNNILQLSDAAGGAFDVGISRSGAGILTVDTTTGGNALGTASMAGLVVSGATITLSGLGSASGTPDSVCLNTNTLKRNAALTCTVSSRDFKIDIEPLDLWKGFGGGDSGGAGASNAFTSLLMNLQPVQFAYIDHPERSRWGFISEQVAGVDRRFADGWDAAGVPRSLDQNAILSITVKTVQEQQFQIQELKDQMRRLSK